MKKRVIDKLRAKLLICLAALLVMSFGGCGNTVDNKESGSESEVQTESDTQAESDITTESDGDENDDENDDELHVPDRDEVLAMREKVLAGMSEEEIHRLTEDIKAANLRMENAYFDEAILTKLSDPESPYWQFFEKEGEFQVGWWYNHRICSKEMIMFIEGISEEEFEETYTEPGIEYNETNAENWALLLEELNETVKDVDLSADLEHLASCARLAAQTHDVTYADEIFKTLHDMDYFLLRYGVDDVGPYVKNNGWITTYYGVLRVYQ